MPFDSRAFRRTLGFTTQTTLKKYDNANSKAAQFDRAALLYLRASNICFAIATDKRGGTALPISSRFMPSEP